MFDDVARWVEHVPEFSTAVRRVDGALAGVAMFVPGDAVPPWALGDPAVIAVLAHMDRHEVDPATTLIGVVPHTPHPGDADLIEIVRVSNSVMVTRTGMPNPRHLYAPFWVEPTTPTLFLESMGYQRIAALDREVGGAPVATWLADFGAGGLVGLIAAMVAAENDTTPPLESPETASILAALRDYTDDDAMAARDPDGSAQVQRRRVREAIESVFDDSATDQKLRRVLELTHLQSGLGEAAILARLHLSRATYYRHLRVARGRLVAGHPARGRPA